MACRTSECSRARTSEAASLYQLFRYRDNWYLTGTPELLALAAGRLEAATGGTP